MNETTIVFCPPVLEGMDPFYTGRFEVNRCGTVAWVQVKLVYGADYCFARQMRLAGHEYDPTSRRRVIEAFANEAIVDWETCPNLPAAFTLGDHFRPDDPTYYTVNDIEAQRMIERWKLLEEVEAASPLGI